MECDCMALRMASSAGKLDDDDVTTDVRCVLCTFSIFYGMVAFNVISWKWVRYVSVKLLGRD